MFEERQKELEEMAKGIIVDIHMLKIQKDSIIKMLETKEEQLKNIGVILQELKNIDN